MLTRRLGAIFSFHSIGMSRMIDNWLSIICDVRSKKKKKSEIELAWIISEVKSDRKRKKFLIKNGLYIEKNFYYHILVNDISFK